MDVFKDRNVAERVRLAMLSAAETGADRAEMEEMTTEHPACFTLVIEALRSLVELLPESDKHTALSILLIAFHQGRTFEREFTAQEEG